MRRSSSVRPPMWRVPQSKDRNGDRGSAATGGAKFAPNACMFPSIPIVQVSSSPQETLTMPG